MKEKIYLIFGLMILFFALPFQSAFSQRQKSFVCVKTIKSSQNRIHSAEFSPDGKYILSVAEDRMIKTRNANNYQLRLVIKSISDSLFQHHLAMKVRLENAFAGTKTIKP